MEARIGGETHRFYSPVAVAPNYVVDKKKKSLEWDLNDWKWDGDLFIAQPLDSVPSDCRSRQFFPIVSEIPAKSNSSSSYSDGNDVVGIENGKVELEKRRRVVLVDHDEVNDETGSPTLKLGGHVYPIVETGVVNWEGQNGKRAKFQGGNSSRSVCQVEDCGADLGTAKEYHRRHKVCEMHAKASSALVGNVMQRFCQQCSRFHLLQEFDEGKRSCRRRLAGHNKRRRKTHPDAIVGGSSLNDDQTSSYLLIHLLRILSSLHSNNSDQTNDQDLFSHLLRNLASISSTFDGRNLSGLLKNSQDLQIGGNSAGTFSEIMPALVPNGGTCVTAQESSGRLCSASKMNGGIEIQDPSMKHIDQTGSVTVAAVGMSQKGIVTDNSPKFTSLLPLQRMPLPECSVERIKVNNFDLNNIYNDSQDCVAGPERAPAAANLVTGSVDCPSCVLHDSHQTSPPQTSGNSDSASPQSASSSNGDAQSRTDRIVFKLFGKNPSDFPLVLRTQILDWLSHSPTNIESYIRPGCIILTIYLRLKESIWDELCCNLSSSLNRLLDISGDAFWRTGWICARVQHQVAFIYNGQVVLDIPLVSGNHCRISSVTPIAVSVFERTDFTVKGFNLSRSTMRLLCAFEGKYLNQETEDVSIEISEDISVESTDAFQEHNELQCVSFSCFLPNVTGRGFIEVEDHALSSGFFPFIVAEQDICSEIRMLESTIEVAECDDDDDINEYTEKLKAKNQALEFLHEMGWLLRRCQLRSGMDHTDYCLDIFPLTRFTWLMDFSLDHDWCSVVKKLLDILFNGTVDSGGHSSVELAVAEMCLLHKAVRRNCRPMVEFLLRYIPDKDMDKSEPQHDSLAVNGSNSFLFSPDTLGPSGMTPLHIAASRDGAESVLDALTDDPGKVGIQAWKSARDGIGFTPENYARLRGCNSYIHLRGNRLLFVRDSLQRGQWKSFVSG
eukprot:TRINITY_DN15665_c3_g2_i2.p1 TRINITY_DN15665_c3_g2~~TRINITY_DN15665_c3_g2_i2.p1  ORF type:complete len:950 (-),score=169.80 TRINITY_DN15665_c3_g2_i2:156-3005(-)